MKKEITFCDFCDEFRKADRQNQFSYEAKRALFDYLEEIEPDYSLDVIALCCEYTEYESLEEFNGEYDEAESIEEISDRTFVLGLGNGAFIIQNY